MHRIGGRQGKLSVVTTKSCLEDLDLRDELRKGPNFSILRYGAKLDRPLVTLYIRCLYKESTTCSPVRIEKTPFMDDRRSYELRGSFHFGWVKYEVLTYAAYTPEWNLKLPSRY